MSMSAKLMAFLGLDGKNFAAGMDGAKVKATSFSKHMDGVGKRLAGALSVTAVAGFAASSVKYFGDIADKADALGISAEKLQAIIAAGAGAGVDSEKAVGALEKIRVAQGKIYTDKTLPDSFKQLGLSIDDVAGMRAEDIFARIGKAIRDTGDTQANFNAVTDVFGAKLGPKMLAMLREIAGDGMDTYTAKAKQMGLVVEDATVQMADKWSDSWDRMVIRAKAAAMEIIETIGNINKGPNDSEKAVIERAQQIAKSKGMKPEVVTEATTQTYGGGMGGAVTVVDEKKRALQADLMAQARLQLKEEADAKEQARKLEAAGAARAENNKKVAADAEKAGAEEAAQREHDAEKARAASMKYAESRAKDEARQQKISDLESEKAIINGAKAPAGTSLAAMKLQQRALEMEKTLGPTMEAAKGDAYTRMGAQIGRQDTPAERTAQRQLRIAEETLAVNIKILELQREDSDA